MCPPRFGPQALTGALLFNKPGDPRSYMVKYLESVKLNGTPPLFSEQDLDAMFGMFDLTNRGVITSEQANSALKSILGPSADLAEVGVGPKAMLRKDEFVKRMMEALRVAIPYKR
jgi:hypothetical protein